MPLDNLFSDDLKNANWIGKVIDNSDPDFEGKIKVKVFGKFDDMADEEMSNDEGYHMLNQFANPDNYGMVIRIEEENR